MADELVLVGCPYYLSCTSEDRWGRIYKHPYKVEGFEGYLPKSEYERIYKFQNFKLSKEAQKQLDNSKYTSELSKLPLVEKEYKESLQGFTHLINEINIESTTSGTYFRYYFIFGEPKEGLQRLPDHNEFIKKQLQEQADILNSTEEWKKLFYPTLEELFPLEQGD